MDASSLRPTEREAQALRHSDFVTGWGDARLVTVLGAAAGLLIASLPLLLIAVNGLMRLVLGGEASYSGSFALLPTVFSALLPDLVALSCFGALLATLRRRSIRTDAFRFMPTPWGRIRLGLDDLVGLIVGTPLIWLMYTWHDAGRLFFVTGAQLHLYPLLGWILAKVWEALFNPLVRRWVSVSLGVAVEVIVRQTLAHHRNAAELFAVEKVEMDDRTRTLTISGKGTRRFALERGEERLREWVCHIPIVKEHITRIRIVTHSTDSSDHAS